MIESSRTLRLQSSEVLLDMPLKVEGGAGSRVAASAPALGRLTLRTPLETCKVVVGGHDFGYPPLNEQPMAAGPHQVSLKCPDGTSKDVDVSRSRRARRGRKWCDEPSVAWTSALGLALLAVVAFVALPRAQGNMEEQARRQLQSGLDFYRAGQYSEALKDFQTVAEGYPNSAVADDALLAIATYQLEIQRDPIAARATADSLIKKYATSDGAPMGYVIMGRATIEIDQTPAGLDSALASFDRVPRLFPSSDAVAPALYYGAEVDRRADAASRRSIGFASRRCSIRDRCGRRAPRCSRRACSSPAASRRKRCARCSA